jgi:hypothetical protein
MAAICAFQHAGSDELRVDVVAPIETAAKTRASKLIGVEADVGGARSTLR